ncbi:unnamed protein product [Adineta ricciae]|uniref:Uncharacterized protein n=1 Tax=Adineta ricciae TaxID=249248 RepID=A0A814S100_ADIRI|nr:unnamed protein product [Adineta ricciae]CAF1521913.1 unnamed protein product [Adineta ricciae]
MNNVERISVIIPKFKQQLLFLEEREKIFRTNVASTELNDSLAISTTSQSLTTATANSSISVFDIEPSADCLPKSSTNNFTDNQSDGGTIAYQHFPDQYDIPPLPNNLMKDVADGMLIKFGPHYSNRQILIDTVSYDLINKYKLFYPSPKQFDQIGSAIVKFLKLPLTKDNISIWKDALQTKLKRKRSEHSDNTLLQDYRSKYSRLGSGRPVKRRINEIAQRDRYKQMMIIPYNDHIANDIDTKVNQLHDVSQLDTEIKLNLWRQTFPYRREYIRNQTTAEIIQKFPGYSDSVLIFEEIKLLLQIDLAGAIRRQTQIILDKIVSSPAFVTDSAPIRLMKVLCREFGETIQHLLSDNEPSTPYPTLVCIDDTIHVYVDFTSIVSTDSPDDAVALLIAMYTIFELSFDKKSRTVRLLYAALHAETRYLTNSVRVLIKDKNIDIYAEKQHHNQQQQNQTIPISPSNSSTTHENESEPTVQIEIHSSADLPIQDNLLVSNQLIGTTSLSDDRGTNPSASVDTYENSEGVENTSSPQSKFQSQSTS